MQQDTHPTDLELSRYLDGRLEPGAAARIHDHLESCLACRVHTGGDRLGEPAEAHPDDRTLAGLLAAVPRLAERTVEALNTPRTIERISGQLWRLEWRGAVILALLLEDGDDTERLVAPVTTDPDWGDQYTVRIPADGSPLGTPLAVWAALRTPVPAQALDRPLGRVGGEILKTVESAYEAFMREELVGAHQGGEFSTGMPITSTGDERWEYRQQVVTAITAIAEDAVADLAPAEGKGGEDLGTLLYEHGVDPEGLAGALGLPPAEVSELLRGIRALNIQQTEVVENRFGVDAARLAAAQPRLDPAAFSVLASPHVRDLFEDAAQRQGRGVAELREEFITEAPALAARSTGQRRDAIEAWEGIIRAWLDAPR